jgi:hypothetical protein
MAARRGIDGEPIDTGPINLGLTRLEPLPLPAIAVSDVLAWPDRETIVLAESAARRAARRSSTRPMNGSRRRRWKTRRATTSRQN